jgi:hypothetical protein
VPDQKDGPGWFEDAALVVHRPLVLDPTLAAQAVEDAQRILRESAERVLVSQGSGSVPFPSTARRV